MGFFGWHFTLRPLVRLLLALVPLIISAAAYFGAGQYAVRTGGATPEEAAELPTVCTSTVFNPELPPTEAELAAEEESLLEQVQPTPIPVTP